MSSIRKLTANISKATIQKLIYGTADSLPDETTNDKAKTNEEIKEEIKFQVQHPTFDKERYVRVGERESKQQVFLMLYLYFVCDRFGFVQHHTKSAIAKKIGCSMQTINANLKRLEERGYICLGGREYGRVNLWINGYQEQSEKKAEAKLRGVKQGKNAIKGKKELGGYYVMSLSLFDELLKVDEVNLLRLVLKGCLGYDSSSMQSKHYYLDGKALRKVSPSRHHPKAMKKMMEKVEKFKSFNLYPEERKGFIGFAIDAEYSGKHFIRNTKKNASEYLDKVLFGLRVGVKEDIIALACQYGLDRVQDVIDLTERDFIFTEERIGAYIRTIIERDNEMAA